MQLYDDGTKSDFSCLFISRSPELHSAIDRCLSAVANRIQHERDTAAALRHAEEQNTPVIIAAYDVGWGSVLNECSRLRNQPSVVVLLPNADPLAWADALSQGAVDAVSITADQSRLLWTLHAAYRRWERRQLVRQALDQNPMMRSA